MERLTRAAGTDADAMLALLGGCNSETDGIELAYQALDLVVARYHLSGAQLVLRPGSMAPQIFVHGRGHVAPDVADGLARRPSGLYATPDAVPLIVQDALTGCCEMALAAHASRHQAGQVMNGLAARHVMEDAVRRWASRSARFRWRFTLVLLGTVGIGAPGSRWQALAEAVRGAGRLCDEAGAAGPGHAAAILADAGPDDVNTYVARLREALAGSPAGDVQLVVGSVTAPADSVDPDQLWRLCEQRLAGAAPAGSRAARTAAGRARRMPAASEVELELRCLPDVVSVGTTGLTGPEARLQSVTAVTRRRNDTAHREAADLAVELLGDVPLTVLDGTGSSVAPAPGPSAASANGSEGGTSNGSRQPGPAVNGAVRALAGGGANGSALDGGRRGRAALRRRRGRPARAGSPQGGAALQPVRPGHRGQRGLGGLARPDRRGPGGRQPAGRGGPGHADGRRGPRRRRAVLPDIGRPRQHGAGDAGGGLARRP